MCYILLPIYRFYLLILQAAPSERSPIRLTTLFILAVWEWEAEIGALAWWPLSTRIGLCDTLSLHFISWTSCIIHLISDLRSRDTIVNCLTRTWMTCAIIISTEAIIFCDTFFFFYYMSANCCSVFLKQNHLDYQ